MRLFGHRLDNFKTYIGNVFAFRNLADDLHVSACLFLGGWEWEGGNMVRVRNMSFVFRGFYTVTQHVDSVIYISFLPRCSHTSELAPAFGA
jgi:hypothetical protein